MLAEGSLNLTAMKLLAPHLTASNHLGVLQSARGKRKPEVQEIVARLSPRPDVPSSIRRLPSPNEAQAAKAAAPSARPAPPSPLPAAAVTPLSSDRYKLQLTIAGDTLERLRLAKDMLAHALPSTDDAVIIDRALRVLLADLAKKKFADTRSPRRSGGSKPGPIPPVAAADPAAAAATVADLPPTAAASPPGAAVSPPAVLKRTRSVSAAVKRVVWLRDLGTCAFMGNGGHRCGERRFVEFHHVAPYALGGEATADGIQLRCRRHNDYEGRIYFGKRRGSAEGGALREKALEASRASTPGELVLEQGRLDVARSTS